MTSRVSIIAARRCERDPSDASLKICVPLKSLIQAGSMSAGMLTARKSQPPSGLEQAWASPGGTAAASPGRTTTLQPAEDKCLSPDSTAIKHHEACRWSGIAPAAPWTHKISNPSGPGRKTLTDDFIPSCRIETPPGSMSPRQAAWPLHERRSEAGNHKEVAFNSPDLMLGTRRDYQDNSRNILGFSILHKAQPAP